MIWGSNCVAVSPRRRRRWHSSGEVLMSESEVTGAPAGDASAGAMLRAAREKQGLHIAVLAATIKVPRPKLEALEADRYEELPDVTFTRALAQTMCRALKIDAEPVLARLPEGGTHKLEPIGGGLNTPFRDPSRHEPSERLAA